MQLNYPSTTYEGNTPVKRQSFQITDLRMVANLLTNMYSDPVLAVVREYICNAIDSHRQSGRTDPISVKAPTIFDSNLVIQDYGLGMSDQQVIDLFSTYGASSKRSSNEMIGGFGIGSKSAFAYAQSFTVESTFNGMCSVYTAYIDNADGPQIERISSTRTQNQNGFKVSIPVKQADISKFHSKIAQIVKFIDFPVALGGMHPPDIPTPIFSFNSIGYYRDRTTLPSCVAVRMGGVVYKTKATVRSGCLLIDAPIGAFELAPSREEIIHNSESERKIEEIIKEGQDDFVTFVLNSTKGIKPRYEKNAARFRLFSDNPFFWPYQNPIYNALFPKLKNKLSTVSCGYKRRLSFGEKTHIEYMNPIAIFDRGTIKNPNSSLKQFFDRLPKNTCVYLVSDQKELLKLWVKLGRPNCPMSSVDNERSLFRLFNPPTISKSTGRVNGPVKLWELSSNGGYNEIQTNFSEQRFYLKTEDGRLVNTGRTLGSQKFMQSELHKDGFRDIVIVPKSYWHRIPANWTDASHFVRRYYHLKLREQVLTSWVGYHLDKLCVIKDWGMVSGILGVKRPPCNMARSTLETVYKTYGKLVYPLVLHCYVTRVKPYEDALFDLSCNSNSINFQNRVKMLLGLAV